MNLFEERLNDRLKYLLSENTLKEQPSNGFDISNAELEQDPILTELVEQAQYLQQAPQLQVTPDFARQLERRLLRHHAEIKLQRKKQRRFLFAALHARPVLATVLGICLLLCLLGTSLLAYAAHISDPTNPFYGITRWEQHVQISLTNNPADQATLQLRFAHEQLDALASLTEAGHAGQYRQTLMNLDQHIHAATVALDQLPKGTQRTRLKNELASLKLDVIQELHRLLSRLSLSERLITTNELSQVGDTVPLLTQATLLLPSHPNERATIRFSGKDMQSGAQLLIDGKVVSVSGALQNNQMVFVLQWQGDLHPHSLGILNPDGTAVETTTISMQNGAAGSTSENNQNGNGHKPDATPTPNKNGHKPDATPTPQGNKPDATPTSHR